MEQKNNQYHPSIVFHPGELLQEKLEESGMGIKEFAIRTGKPEKTIFAVINGSSSLTVEMAILFEEILKIPAHFWTNLQRNYDEFIARQKRQEEQKRSESWARNFPYAKMVKLGWVKPATKISDKVVALLKFFGFTTHESWEKYYLEQALKSNFKISLAHLNEKYAISAWLRHGEIEADKLVAGIYDRSLFVKRLPELKSLMAERPEEFLEQIKSLSLECGVKVIYTPSIPKAPISGATRWINDNPLIQLSGRYKSYDSFWFTFFHEVGHILLHGKREVFLENIDYSDKDLEKEEEADNFARKWTL